MITDLAMDCDVLVHEATNTYLVGRDKTDLERITRLSVKHGHSTPFMAGSFAKRIRAKRLVLNHFSGRYSGDDRAKSVREPCLCNVCIRERGRGDIRTITCPYTLVCHRCW